MTPHVTKSRPLGRLLLTVFLTMVTHFACAQALPQEMVYIHMDNNCYFLGDTIYYKAYVQRSDTGKPTTLSTILYVELLNQDGYLVEREVLRLKDGQAAANFCLVDTMYSGFYELRAYTRWQLNFGRHPREHNKVMDQWFLKKEYAEEYFVDYDKLYSRVFPVYDKPQKPGDYYPDMVNCKPLRRDYLEEKHNKEAQVGWYPEGGALVAGLRQRIAFEVRTDEGKQLDGRVIILSEDNDTLWTAATENRGRGTIEVTMEAGKKYKALFVEESGATTSLKLPKAGPTGAVMRVSQTSTDILADIQLQGTESDSITLSVTTCGRKDLTMGYEGKTIAVPLDSLPGGVAQLRLTRGARILADRLVFVHKPSLVRAPLQISGQKAKYTPLERVELGVNGPAGATVSVAVRDKKTMASTYDTGNIMTEMLLSSHVKGFVENPSYYFETDDSVHRHHLDLLLMVQGWRRFGETLTKLAEPYEKSPIITGEVNKFTALEEENSFSLSYREIPEEDEPLLSRGLLGPLPIVSSYNHRPFSVRPLNTDMNNIPIMESTPMWYWSEFELYRNGGEVYVPIYHPINTFLFEHLNSPGKETHLHAEFLQYGAKPVYGDITVGKDGKFNIQGPHFYGYCFMHLAGATIEDATKVEEHATKKRLFDKTRTAAFQWILPKSDKEPVYSVRVHRFFPNYVSPFDYYQTQYMAMRRDEVEEGGGPMLEGVKYMNEVRVKAKHRILRDLDLSKPTLVLDAYDAFNQIVDAGLTTAYYAGSMTYSTILSRLIVGDMGINRAYDMERRWNGVTLTHNYAKNWKVQTKYNSLENLDKVYIYTDYAPRKRGSSQYIGSDQPCVVVDLHLFPDNATQRTYRDRYCMLPGYETPLEFYHPDYSRHPLPDGQKDYRRTLYWNPNLALDENGQADISFYNNSGTTVLSIEAEGQAADGTLLWGK